MSSSKVMSQAVLGGKLYRFFNDGRTEYEYNGVFRPIRRLKEGGNLAAWRASRLQLKPPYPVTAKRVPTIATLNKWSVQGRARALDGAWVEPDGYSPTGAPSWLIALGLI